MALAHPVPQAAAPHPSIPALIGRIESSIEYAAKLFVQADAIAIRLFGEGPTSAQVSTLGQPAPVGEVAAANEAIDRLGTQLDRLSDALGRIEYVG